MVQIGPKLNIPGWSSELPVFVPVVWSLLGPVPDELVDPEILLQSNLSVLMFVKLQAVSKLQDTESVAAVEIYVVL